LRALDEERDRVEVTALTVYSTAYSKRVNLAAARLAAWSPARDDPHKRRTTTPRRSLVFDDDEEVMGEPAFELRLRDGEPQVSGCYFMHPALQVESADWDEQRPRRILVTASDGSHWYADDVPAEGTVNVRLRPVEV
jgi:hypothetical protein